MGIAEPGHGSSSSWKGRWQAFQTPGEANHRYLDKMDNKAPWSGRPLIRYWTAGWLILTGICAAVGAGVLWILTTGLGLIVVGGFVGGLAAVAVHIVVNAA